MTNIAIFGAGGFGREVACLIKRINEHIDLEEHQWRLIGFFDDGKEKGSRTEYGEILGGMDDLNKWPTPLAVAIAIGSPRAIKAISEKITNPNISFPNLIAPDVVFYDRPHLAIGRGNIICPQCLISCNVTIGNFNIFNFSTTVGHDAQIGNCNSIMPAVRISGEVKIGDCNFFGVGSIVLQQQKIGDMIRLAAGSVLTTKPKDCNLYLGVPARRFKI